MSCWQKKIRFKFYSDLILNKEVLNIPLSVFHALATKVELNLVMIICFWKGECHRKSVSKLLRGNFFILKIPSSIVVVALTTIDFDHQ